MVLALPMMLLPACGSEGGQPLEPDLFADPEVCDVPCEVVFDSGLEGTEGRPLTFTWDFGDGPAAGDARMLHTFEAAGSHTVVVTVLDGQSNTTATTVVLAEPQPKATGTIGGAGGSVSQGACTVTVPEGIAPEAFTLDLIELPSMQTAAERAFGADQFVPLSKAYDVAMLLKSSTAIDIAVTVPEVEGEGSADLAWLVRTLAQPDLASDDLAPFPSPAPLADYTLLPVTRVDDGGTAHGQIYGRKRFQLVKLAEPLDTRSFPATEDFAPKATPRPLLITIFKDSPTKLSKSDFESAILNGLAESHEVLVNQRGFYGPDTALVVFVSKMPKPNMDGYVQITDPRTIHINRELATADAVKKAMAHEFFHCIQNLGSNLVSSASNHKKDGWFKEGTASWAMDEVFDKVQGHYFAPTRERFAIPLLKETNDASPYDTYQTVAFWKWAEANKPSIVRHTIEDRRSATHMQVPSVLHVIENVMIVDYLDSFKRVWTDVDFLSFTYDARYLKDFDIEEFRAGELWSPDPKDYRLGKPKKVDEDAHNVALPGTGSSESEPVLMAFEVLPHLTAQVLKIESSGLTGTLHVRFPVTEVPLDARVLLTDAQSNDALSVFAVRDLSKKHGDVELNFDPDKRAYIFIVDPEWSYPSSATPTKGEIAIWVSPGEPSTPWPVPPEFLRRHDSAGGTVELGTGVSSVSSRKNCSTSQTTTINATASVSTGCITDALNEVTRTDIEPYYVGPLSASWSFTYTTDLVESSGTVESTSQTSVSLSETELVMEGSLTASASAVDEGNQVLADASSGFQVHFKVPSALYELTWDCKHSYVQLNAGPTLIVSQRGDAPTWQV